MDTHGRNYNLKCHTAAIVTFLCLHSQFEKFIYQVYEFEITTAHTCFFVFFFIGVIFIIVESIENISLNT